VKTIGKFLIMTPAELDTEKGASYSAGAMEGHRLGVIAGKISAGGRSGGFAANAAHWKALAAEKDLRIAVLVEQLKAYQEDPDPLPAPVGYVTKIVLTQQDEPHHPGNDEIIATDGNLDTPADFDEVAAQVGNERREQNVVNSKIETMSLPGQDPRD
jgi:hypothetical protein